MLLQKEISGQNQSKRFCQQHFSTEIVVKCRI